MSVIGSGKVNINGAATEESVPAELILKNVKVVEVVKRIEVPSLVEVPREQTKWVSIEQEQIKYNTILKETVRYVPKEEDTIKFNCKEVETLKFVPKEVVVDFPIRKDVVVEVPVRRDVPFDTLSESDIKKLQELAKSIPVIINKLSEATLATTLLTEEIDKLEKRIAALKDVKMVEEIIKVPKLEYQTIEVERILWKDVVREKPSA